MKFRSCTLLIVIIFSAQAAALEPEACAAAAKQIDDRIAAGNHPELNVQLAAQLRDSLPQSCPYLDEATLAGMLQSLDQLLPSGDTATVVQQQSPAERKAEREAQRAEADRQGAERDRRRAEVQARKDAEGKLVSDVARKPPTGRSAKGQLMDRLDPMWGASIVDWDLYRNKARLLYLTRPSREQWSRADAALHYYVVEFDRDDNIQQRHVVELDSAATVHAALVRGRDEIVLQVSEVSPDRSKRTESTLERWSIPNGKRLSSSPAPKLDRQLGTFGPAHHFKLVTARGELFYASSVPLESGPSPKLGVSWMLASLNGEVLDKGFIEHEAESVGTDKWFHSANGSAGLILGIGSIGDAGIDSQLKPEVHRFGDADVHPTVFSERRLYTVGNAETGASLPAFQRQLIWMGLEKVDQATMISGESTRLMSEAEDKYRVNDSAVGLAVAGDRRDAVAPITGGHALLVKNNHRNDAFPPTTGLWLQEFAVGKPRRDTYLNPDAKHLKAGHNMLASDGGDKLYVAGQKYVMRLDAERELTAYAESRADGDDVKAMVADGDSVWLFGDHSSNLSQQQVWVERLQF